MQSILNIETRKRNLNREILIENIFDIGLSIQLSVIFQNDSLRWLIESNKLFAWRSVKGLSNDIGEKSGKQVAKTWTLLTENVI